MKAKKRFILAFLIVIIVVLLGVVSAQYVYSPGPSGSSNTIPTLEKKTNNPTDVSNFIIVEVPRTNSIVSNSFVVKGQARGMWYFEASFPVTLRDANGKELTTGIAQAEGEWMTENFVPFTVSLAFENPSTSTGELVLEKANASGLPEHDRSLVIPVRFK